MGVAPSEMRVDDGVENRRVDGKKKKRGSASWRVGTSRHLA